MKYFRSKNAEFVSYFSYFYVRGSVLDFGLGNEECKDMVIKEFILHPTLSNISKVVASEGNVFFLTEKREVYCCGKNKKKSIDKKRGRVYDIIKYEMEDIIDVVTLNFYTYFLNSKGHVKYIKPEDGKVHKLTIQDEEIKCVSIVPFFGDSFIFLDKHGRIFYSSLSLDKLILYNFKFPIKEIHTNGTTLIFRSIHNKIYYMGLSELNNLSSELESNPIKLSKSKKEIVIGENYLLIGNNYYKNLKERKICIIPALLINEPENFFIWKEGIYYTNKYDKIYYLQLHKIVRLSEIKIIL